MRQVKVSEEKLEQAKLSSFFLVSNNADTYLTEN